ncbi:MAG: hypothetical protein LRZ85_04630 [Alphaproteobacteria bacterium]|nr:hypothetical protein [Alphaproteobacteria bacterium]
MKKIHFLLLLSAFALSGTITLMSEPSLAQTPSLEELKAQEEGTISEIRAKIEDLKTKVPKNYTAADIILKKNNGSNQSPR